jgi:hypothetical protein
MREGAADREAGRDEGKGQQTEKQGREGRREGGGGRLAHKSHGVIRVATRYKSQAHRAPTSRPTEKVH